MDVTVYLSSPNNQCQAEHALGMSVLFSFASWRPYLAQFQAGYPHILIDSGAYTELSTGKKVDVAKYGDWSMQWKDTADAIAGVDDIAGDWRKSVANYLWLQHTFPTFHDTDPPELLDDLIAMARERSRWIAIGLKPPRSGKDNFIRATLDRIPPDLHVHGWALRAYTKYRRIDSVDSTNWFRDAMDLRAMAPLRHLCYGECLEIIIKRYQRQSRALEPLRQEGLFEAVPAGSERDLLDATG